MTMHRQRPNLSPTLLSLCHAAGCKVGGRGQEGSARGGSKSTCRSKSQGKGAKGQGEKGEGKRVITIWCAYVSRPTHTLSETRIRRQEDSQYIRATLVHSTANVRAAHFSHTQMHTYAQHPARSASGVIYGTRTDLARDNGTRCCGFAKPRARRRGPQDLAAL